MKRATTLSAVLLGAASAALILLAQPSVSSEDDDYEFAPLPRGEGADLVYYNCIACHSLRTVTNGGYSRAVWDELLDWMVEEQGMPEMPADERAAVLEYLATYVGEE